MGLEFHFGVVKSSGDDAGDAGRTMSMCLALKIAAMVSFMVCVFYHNETKFLNKRSGSFCQGQLGLLHKPHDCLVFEGLTLTNGSLRR